MHRKSKTIVRLTSAKTLNEAINILTHRNAPSIFKMNIETAFNLKNDKNNMIRNSMLSETEEHLTSYEKTMSEVVHTEVSTEGDSRKDDSPTGQADGRELDDIIESPTENTGSETASQQTGETQLDTALTKISETHTVDPMNKAIMDYMEDGMSQVEAGNAVTADKNLSEAVFNQLFQTKIVPLLKAVGADMKSLRETIITTDRKVEVSRIPEKTMSETVITQPQYTTQSGVGEKYHNDIEKINTTKSIITNKYMQN